MNSFRTHVEFRSSKFPPYDDEEGQVNPKRYGRRLAEYIRQHLVESGLQCDDIRAEDWGWVVPVRNDTFNLWVGCGNYEEYQDGFLCFIEPSKPVIRTMFKKVDTTPQVTRLADTINRILTSDSEIRDVRWWVQK